MISYINRNCFYNCCCLCDTLIYKCTFRFESFAPVRDGKAAWFVDGCDYLAAIANAIDKVRQ